MTTYTVWTAVEPVSRITKVRDFLSAMAYHYKSCVVGRK